MTVVKPTASRKSMKCRTPWQSEWFYTMVAVTEVNELLSSATLSVLPVMEAFDFTESFMPVKPSVGVLPALLFAMVIILLYRRNRCMSCRPLSGWVCDTTPSLCMCLSSLLLSTVVNLALATQPWLPLWVLLYKLTRWVTLCVAVGALFAMTPMLTLVPK